MFLTGIRKRKNCGVKMAIQRKSIICHFEHILKLSLCRRWYLCASVSPLLRVKVTPNKVSKECGQCLPRVPGKQVYPISGPVIINHMAEMSSSSSSSSSVSIYNQQHSLASGAEMAKPNFKLTLASKYAGLQNNLWVEFVELNAKLKPLNLGQGFPDFMPSDKLVKELAKCCDVTSDPLLHQYTRAYGHPRLVKALAQLYSRLINRTINPMTEILVTGGAYGSLFAAIMSHVNAEDEVIIIEPYFDCYEPLVKLSGGICRFIPLKPTDPEDDTSASWKLDINELESMFNSKTKAIILNTPNNPLGKVFTKSELQVIANLCIEHNVLVISDEVYEWIVYEGSEHIRIASLEGMWDRTITIGSAGKTFSLTGWKLGWAYGPAELMKNLFVAHQNCVYTCQTPGQEALAVGLEKEVKRLGTPASFFCKMSADLKQRRDVMTRSLKDAGLKTVIPEGGYFMLADWKPLEPKIDLSEETDEWADYRFVKYLAKTWKLLGIPPSAFYSQDHKSLAQDYIRLCFYKKTETLQQADEILKKLKNSK